MEAFAVTNTRRPRPIDGWALAALIDLDEAHPGTLRLALSGSALRRQAFFITMSLLRNGVEEVAGRLRPLCADQPQPSPLAEVASVLATCRVRDIVRALYGDVEGLVGALGRLGHDPLHPVTYRSLVAILSLPEHRHRAKVLRVVPKITSSTLSILLALKPPFILPELVDRFGSVRDVHQFEAAIALIKNVQPHLTEPELITSLKALSHRTDLGSWVNRMIGRAARFPVVPPVHDDPDFIWLHSAEALAEAGDRFGNCLRSKAPLCALGRVAYLEYRPRPAIVALDSLSGGHFVLDGIYGVGNSRVEGEVARTIRHKLVARGVLLPARFAHGQPYNSVAKMIGLYDFDRHVQALEDWADEPDLQVMADEVARDLEVA
jgi:hypothetical protein